MTTHPAYPVPSPTDDDPSNTHLVDVRYSQAVSLSVNYLPSKFSHGLLPSISRRRKVKAKPRVPKHGGGREAFKSNEARMPDQDDDDYDGVVSGLFEGKKGGHTRPRMRWTKFKWTLLIANVFLSSYSFTGMVLCLLTWFDAFGYADIVRVGNRTELVLSTIAATAAVITSVFGWAGILLNNRAFLALYTFFLWLCFALLITPGYLAYKEYAFNMEGKLDAQWSRDLGVAGRLRIQNRLHCCGYYSPFVEATVSQTCYARSVLPGCKAAYLTLERHILKIWYTVVFSLVPLHIFVMVASLLCSNHVTYRFGKGMMPKPYRLSLGSMAIIMDNYASQLAKQHGSSISSDTRSRSRANLGTEGLQYTPRTTTISSMSSGHVRDRS